MRDQMIRRDRINTKLFPFSHWIKQSYCAGVQLLDWFAGDADMTGNYGGRDGPYPP